MENLQNFFKNKKVLITGHTGFKGSWLTQTLLNWNADITGIALKPNTKPSLFNLLGIKKKINNYFVDIRDFKKVRKIFVKEKPEIVFHLAAQPLVRDSYEDPLYTFETNILGTVNVLQAIKEIGSVKAVVMVTTDKVYENKGDNHRYKEDDKLAGHDPYSASKAAAEITIASYIKSFFNPKDYGKRHKTLIASARAGNVIGGGDWQKDRLIPDIVKSVFKEKKKIIIRNPNAIRPWQYVIELLYGYILLAKKLYKAKREFSGAWNFGPRDENYLTVRGLTKEAIRILKRGSYIIKRDNTKHEAKYLRLDSGKAKNILGWRSKLNFAKTLELTFVWYQKFYNGENIVKITNEQIESFFDKT